MASITIRKIDDDVKQRLRMQAARKGISMEEHLRGVINQAASARPAPAGHGNLYDAIRALVEPHGGFDLDLPARNLPTRRLPFENWE